MSSRLVKVVVVLLDGIRAIRPGGVVAPGAVRDCLRLLLLGRLPRRFMPV